MAPKIPTASFNNKRNIPIFGLGTFLSKPGQVEEAVKDAIDAGYRHFDCAMIYANEPEVGQALLAKMQDGTVKREELFITSKVWNTFHSKDLVAKALAKTLKDLKLAYLDLYLIHWPVGCKEGTDDLLPKDESGNLVFSEVDYTETWLGMELAVKEGLVKSIGVSNFNKEQIERVLKIGSIVPVTNQVECHPYLTQTKLFDYCKEKGITLTAYSPLGCPARVDVDDSVPVLLEEPRVVAVAEKLKKTAAQVLCRFQIQRGIICIPKSVTKSRIESNFQIWDFELSDADMAELLSLDCNRRYCAPQMLKTHPLYPFNAEF